MKNKIFYDQDHAALYLKGSIIRVDELPVLVENVVYRRTIKGLMLEYRDISERGKTPPKVSLGSSRINMNPVPLGFLNFSDFGKPNSVIRAYRIPCRQWRIGLTTENLRLFPNKFDSHDTKNKVMQSIYLKKAICGEFPSAEEVIENAKARLSTSQAFSRSFAIERRKLKFIQVGEDVGELYKGEIMLFDEYIYLSQLLEKSLCQK